VIPRLEPWPRKSCSDAPRSHRVMVHSTQSSAKTIAKNNTPPLRGGVRFSILPERRRRQRHARLTHNWAKQHQQMAIDLNGQDHRRPVSTAPGASFRMGGAPRTTEHLVVQMAKENPTYAYDRIVGAVLNFGEHVSDQTVDNILRRHCVDPVPTKSHYQLEAVHPRS
jgi:hypothetical protein